MWGKFGLAGMGKDLLWYQLHIAYYAAILSVYGLLI